MHNFFLHKNILIFRRFFNSANRFCISIDEDGNVQDAQFIGGCDGNTKGVCALIKGMKAKEVIARLKGITCGNKPTSCPDQLATALQEMGY